MQEELEKYAKSCDIAIYAFNNEKLLFSYNKDRVQDGACTLKVFIMLEYVRQIYEKIITGNEFITVMENNSATGAGTIKFLSYGMKVRAADLVELMVAISDHMAANLLIEFLGLDNINTTIKCFGFKNTKLLKKYIIPRNKHVGEITAYEYAKFFQMLDKNEFFDEKSCEYMKKILKSQRYKDFIAEPLVGKKNYIDMASKSGKVDGHSFESIANSCVNDGGICFTNTNNYYIAFLSEIHKQSDIKMEEMKILMHKISNYIFEEN